MGQPCCSSELDIVSSSRGRLPYSINNSKNTSFNEEKRLQREAKKFEDWMESVISKGKKFKDPDFMPQKSSIYDKYDREVLVTERTVYDSVIWQRASDLYFGEDLAIFKGGVSPDDIEQGYLGNGYMLTVLSAMCHRPDTVYDLFGTKEVNKAGIYVVYLFVNGVRTPVVIDDYIPVWP